MKMVYTVGEMAKLLGVTASTLRYYDKEGLLPFVERSSGGIRMFRESDIEWLRVIECMKKAGMSIKDIRQYIELALKGDDTIELRLMMFRRQKEVLQQKMAEMQHTMAMVEYKCWYYETAKAARTVEVPQNMKESDVPKQFHDIRRELKNTVIKS
jgi:DNA-binding transcriptional MerR regulator